MPLLNRIKTALINTALSFMSVDEKLVHMILETSPSRVRPIVVLPAVKQTMKYIVGKLEGKSVHGYVYNGKLYGVPVSVIQTRIGAPRTSLVMEALARSGCKAAIRIDFCGGLTETSSEPIASIAAGDNDKTTVSYNPDMPLVGTGVDIGRLVVPARVFLTDGCCMQYIQQYYGKLSGDTSISRYPVLDYAEDPDSVHEPTVRRFPAPFGTYWAINVEPRIYRIVKSFVKEVEKSDISADVLWSTDAMFCETIPAVRTWRAYGCNSVDMESAALYLLGKLYNIPVISLLGVTDLPDSENFGILSNNKIHPKIDLGFTKAEKLLSKILPAVYGEFARG